jgi:tetratricopeptide (TPR) repeat protein
MSRPQTGGLYGRVIIKGLVSRPELNGKRGFVIMDKTSKDYKRAQLSGRASVEVPGEEKLLALKWTNLEVVEDEELLVEASVVRTCAECGRKEQAGDSFKMCGKCRKLDLAPTFYCSEECAVCAWPKHKAVHKAQKKLNADLQSFLKTEEGSKLAQTIEAERRENEEARRQPLTEAQLHDDDTKNYTIALQKGHAARDESNYRQAAKYYRRAASFEIEEPCPSFYLAHVLWSSGDVQGAARMFLKAAAQAEAQVDAMQAFAQSVKRPGIVASAAARRGVGIDQVRQELSRRVDVMQDEVLARKEMWATSLLKGIDALRQPGMEEEPKPVWWTVDGLLDISLKIVQALPDASLAWFLRAQVLGGLVVEMQMDVRDDEHLRQAAEAMERAAALSDTQRQTQSFMELAGNLTKAASLPVL